MTPRTFAADERAHEVSAPRYDSSTVWSPTSAGLTGEADPAPVEDVDVVGQLEGARHVLLDDQQRDALGGQARAGTRRSRRRSWGRAPWTPRRGARSWAGRRRPRASASICCSPPESVPASWLRRCSRRGNTAAAMLDGASVHRARRLEAQVVGHAEGGEDPPALGHVADAGLGQLVGRVPGHVGAVEEDPARARPEQPRHHPEQCRLAGAVRAEQGDHRTVGHDEIHVLEHGACAVAGADIPELKHACTASSSGVGAIDDGFGAEIGGCAPFPTT